MIIWKMMLDCDFLRFMDAVKINGDCDPDEAGFRYSKSKPTSFYDMAEQVQREREQGTMYPLDEDDKGSEKKRATGRRDLTQLSPTNGSMNAKIANAIEKLNAISKNYTEISKPFKIIALFSDAIGAEGGSSKYERFTLPNGERMSIRISNHNANAENYKGKDAPDNNLSIAFKRRRSANKFVPDDDVNIKEFVYFNDSLTNEYIKDIADSLAESLMTGEYIDRTGIAKVNESGTSKYSKSVTPAQDAAYRKAYEDGSCGA